MKTNLIGIHDLLEPDYRALSAINKSGLDRINKSPAHYQAWLRQADEPTPAMILGRAAHAGILEPETFYRSFYARPEGIDGRTKDGKAKLEELAASHAGKTLLKAEDFAMVEAMMRSVRNNVLASTLLAGGKAEMSAIWQDTDSGVLCKARPDYIGTDALIDVKTTDSAEFRAFQRSVRNYRYHVQAAWYLDGVNAAMGGNHFKRFVLIAVEKDAPYEIAVYEFDADAIALGRVEARANLRTYAECVKKNEWPGYPRHILQMTVPVWE